MSANLAYIHTQKYTKTLRDVSCDYVTLFSNSMQNKHTTEWLICAVFVFPISTNSPVTTQHPAINPYMLVITIIITGIE